MYIADNIPLLTELEHSGQIVSYKHLAPTELTHSLRRTDVSYEILQTLENSL